MANYNILGKDWTDIVFEGRNKLYGAYKMREESAKYTAMALLIGIISIGGLFFSGYLLQSSDSRKAKLEDTEGIEMTVIEMPLPPPEPEPEVIPDSEPPPPPPAGASKNVQDEVEFKETVVKKDNEVKNEQKTTQQQFDDNTTSGQKSQEGDKKDGDLKKDGENTGQASKGSKGTENTNQYVEEKQKEPAVDPNKIHRAVQQKAVMPGNWQQRFVKDFKVPEVGGDVKQITLRLSFVVEKDGSLTDIKILNDQYGLSREAERVIKSLPSWTPAEHNGVKVRSQFVQPITIRIN